MKIMHLSDLHIGKRVNEFSMLEDQKYILNQILQILEQNPVEAVLLAGDIYDKAIPPAEAVQVLDEFLTSISHKNIPVFVISGNHDSAERLAFGAQLMKQSGVYVSSIYRGEVEKFCLTDKWGEVWIYLLPFLKPALVRHALKTEEPAEPQQPSDGKTEKAFSMTESIETYQDAIHAVLSRVQPDTDKRNVLVAHQFVTGASRCESEEIAVGGVDQISASLFSDFDYVALGHIHSPQHVTRETVRYCGTPLKYSFSEAEQNKSVTILELQEKGTVSIVTIPLAPLHDMRKLRGTYKEVTDLSEQSEKDRLDYLQITLTDEEDVPDALQKLRIFYPNLMRLEYDNRRTRENRQIQWEEKEIQKSEQELAEEFYEIQNNQPMSQEQKDLLQKILSRLGTVPYRKKMPDHRKGNPVA